MRLFPCPVGYLKWTCNAMNTYIRGCLRLIYGARTRLALQQHFTHQHQRLLSGYKKRASSLVLRMFITAEVPDTKKDARKSDEEMKRE